jgi:hypothetical protein
MESEIIDIDDGNALFFALGSALFVLGSVCYLPQLLTPLWGSLCFVGGSALFLAGGTRMLQTAQRIRDAERTVEGLGEPSSRQETELQYL